MVRAVIFDCFNVLVSCKLPQLFAQYTGNDPAKQLQFQQLCARADHGDITSEQYWPQIAALMGLSLEDCHAVVDAERHRNYELIQYIREDLKPNYKIGLLSNAGHDIWQYITPDLQELFDICLISADMHRCKPDVEVYLEVCRQLQVAPEEAVMVDDSLSNYIGACQAGLRAVEYKSYTQLRHELSDALVVM